MSGKSPMNTVWLLISPVVLLMNSAVTNIGAEYVMSLSLHSSSEYLGGSNRWSRNDRDMVPGEVLDRADLLEDLLEAGLLGNVLASGFLGGLIRAFHLSLPSSQSNDSVCRASRSGTFSGSLIRAKDTRLGTQRFVAEALRDAANRGPSELVAELSPHARQTPHGKSPTEARGESTGGRQSAAQIVSVAKDPLLVNCTPVCGSPCFAASPVGDQTSSTKPARFATGCPA